LETGHYGVWNVMVVTPQQGYGVAGWAAFAIAAVLMLRRRFDVFTAATATFLIAPYGLHYDLTVACLGMGLGMIDERRPWALAALTFGFLVPFIVILGTWFAPPLLLAALFAQVTGLPRPDKIDPKSALAVAARPSRSLARTPSKSSGS
jgi:hypothetical protein